MQGFERDVIPDGGQAKLVDSVNELKFERDVIPDGGQAVMLSRCSGSLV